MSNNERVVVVCDEIAGFVGLGAGADHSGVPLANEVYKNEILAAVEEVGGWRARFFSDCNVAAESLQDLDQRRQVGAVIMSMSSRLRVDAKLAEDPLLAATNQHEIPRATLVGWEGNGFLYLRDRYPDILVPRMPIERVGEQVGGWLTKLRLQAIN